MESLIANNDKLKISFTIIYGDNNEIIGNNNIIYGDKNEIIGNNNVVHGEDNIITTIANTIDPISPTSQGRARRTSSRKKVNIETKIPIFEPGLHTSNNDNICVVCLENTKSTVCIPCGHVIYCIPCVHDITNSIKFITCSICRQPVNEVMKVFLS